MKPNQQLFAVGAGLIIIVFVIMATFQMSAPKPLQLAPTPTEEPTLAPATDAPAPTTAPTATPAALNTPAPTKAVLEAPSDPPMTGRGMTLVEPEAPAQEAAPAEAAPASYIENVGQQAPHCIRTCDGQPGPSGGDWAIVPTGEPQYLNNVGAQAPHKVR